MVSFDSDHSGGDGASSFFLRSVLAIAPVGVSGKSFFVDLANWWGCGSRMLGPVWTWGWTAGFGAGLRGVAVLRTRRRWHILQVALRIIQIHTFLLSEFCNVDCIRL